MRTSAPLAALLTLALVPAAALAQERETPPDPGLPSLTPRVFESRGTVRVSLPDIERQPLSGFGPPPRTYVVPAEREPTVQPFAPDLDALPALVLLPPPEPVAEFDPGASLRAEGGVGSQLARYGRFDLQAAGAAGAFFVDADYDGVSDLGDAGRVGGNQFDVRAGGQSFAPGRLRLEGFALYDRYDTPGSIRSADRTRRAFGAEVGAAGVGRVPFDVEVRFAQTRLGREDDLELETNEGRVDAEGRVAVGAVRLDAAAGTAGAGGLGTDVQYAQAGAAVALTRADGARLVVGLRGLTYDASSLAGGGDSRAAGPIVDLELPLNEAAVVFATNRPRLAVRTLATLTEANPYVAPGVVVAPDVLLADAQAGVALGRGPVRLRGYATGLWAPTYLVFERTGAGDYTERYVGARSLGLGGDASFLTPSGVSVTAGVEVRSGEDEDGADLPFFAPLLGRAGLQVPFARGRGRVGLAAYAEAPRPDGSGDDAPAWGLLSAEVRYDVTGPFSAVVRGEHLVGEAERWPGFLRPPFAVTAGVRFSR